MSKQKPKAKRKPGRPATGISTDRLTVSLPKDLVKQFRKAAGARFDSLSGAISRMVLAYIQEQA